MQWLISLNHPPPPPSQKVSGKMGIVLVLVMAIVAVLLWKKKAPSQRESPIPITPSRAIEESGGEQRSEKKLPTLLELGSDKCTPCKMMMPILQELSVEYAGRMNVETIDVWKQPSVGKRYGIKLIPTLIFLDAEGREVFRHEGLISKEDILRIWKKVGIEIPTPLPSPSPLSP